MDNLIGKVEGLDSIDKLSDRIDKARESIDKLSKGINTPSLNTVQISNQSLGELGRLPPELRNRIYKFALEDNHDEVDIGGVCRPCGSRYKIAFVSKQIYNETIGIIEAVHRGPCNHWAFTIRMPAIRQLISPASVQAAAVQFSLGVTMFAFGATRKIHSHLKRGSKYCFRGAHLHSGAPEAVIITLPKPTEQTPPDVEILGASDGLNTTELSDLESHLRGEVRMLIAFDFSADSEEISSKTFAWMASAVYHYIRLRIVASARTRREKAKEERKGVHTGEQESEQKGDQQ